MITQARMNTNVEKIAKMESVKMKLSTLWIVVVINMLYADIISFMKPGTLEKIISGNMDGIEINQTFLLGAAFILQIPILMILFSRVLDYKRNRLANIVAATLTIALVIVGGSASSHYILIASIEVVCMLVIIWYAWKWQNPELTTAS